jgi:hypothetical protein
LTFSVETHLNGYILTDVGVELASLCDVEPDEEYCAALIEEWEQRGIEVQAIESEE